MIIIIPEFLLDSNNDGLEWFRETVYPILHHGLAFLGDMIRLTLFAIAEVGWPQYVGEFLEDEDVIEAELEDLSSVRNPVASYKYLPDGRESEGSWVVLHEDKPKYIEEGMQLHLILFKREEGAGREIYAHYEHDWRVSPLKHLRGTEASAQEGVHRGRRFLDETSLLILEPASGGDK